MAPDDILNEELSLYRKLVERHSSNGSLSDRDAKLDFDDVVSYALFVIDRIRERRRAFSEASCAANLIVMPNEESNYLVQLYKGWLAETQRLVEQVRRLIASGIAVPQSEDLLEAYRDIRLMNFDIDRIKQSIIDAMEGRGKPLREAADDFRRRRYAQSA